MSKPKSLAMAARLAGLETGRPVLFGPAVVVAATLCAGGIANASIVEFSDVFSTSGQSMWGTGSAAILNFHECLCVTWDKTVTTPRVSSSVGGGIFGPPNVSVSAALRGRATGKAGVDVGFKFDSGSVNAQTPVTTRLEFPDAGALAVGQLFTLKATTTKGTDSFSTIFPELQAYADAILNAGIDLDLLATARQDGVVRYDGAVNLVAPSFKSTTELASFNRNDNGQAKILPAITGGLPGGFQFGEEQSIKAAGVEVATATIWIPDLDTTSAPNAGGAHSSGSTDLFALQADLDGIATVASGGSIPPLENSFDVAKITAGPAELSLSARYNIVDVEMGPVFDINQAFDLASIIQTTLYFDAPVKIMSGGTLIEVTELPVAALDEVQILYEGHDIGVTARNTISATLRNQTSLGFDFLIDLAALSAGLSLDGSVDFGFPFGVQSFNFANLNLGPVFSDTERLTGADFGNLYDQTFALAGYQTLERSFIISADPTIVVAVPAPASLSLFCAGLVLLACGRRRKEECS
ncbi:hypothetical protein [Desertibaculum subflavum]|uniref:hypothetical protein n=1 Tax=Desertibaculum subflavum TaxID=2268458 RepID=UPI0013C4CC4E